MLHQCLHLRDGADFMPWVIDESCSAVCESPCYSIARRPLTMSQYTIGAFLSAVSLNIVRSQSPDSWRNAVLSQFAICGVAIIAWFFIPESPRWHCMYGREEKCKQILRKVNGKVEGYDVDQEYVRMLIEVNHRQESDSHKKGGSYLDVWRGTNLVRAVLGQSP